MRLGGELDCGRHLLCGLAHGEGIGLTLRGMADRRGAVVAWSAGASAAGAALAVLFADGKPVWHRALFIVFVVIAIAAFVILVGAGLQGLLAWLRARARRQKPPEAPPSATPPDETSDSPRIWVQENVANDQGQAFGAQGGNVILHQAGPTEPHQAGPAEPPSPALPADEAGN
jgi:hypothetical protein